MKRKQFFRNIVLCAILVLSWSSDNLTAVPVAHGDSTTQQAEVVFLPLC